jgi:hypothetical protein
MRRVALPAALAWMLGACAHGRAPAASSGAVSVDGAASEPPQGDKVILAQSGSTATFLLEDGSYRMDVPLEPAGGKRLSYLCVRGTAREGAAIKGLSLHHGTVAPGVPPKDLRPMAEGPRRVEGAVCSDGVEAKPIVVRVLVDRMASVDLVLDTPFQRQELLPLHRGTPSHR